MNLQTKIDPVATFQRAEPKPITVSFQTARQLSGLGLTTLWALAKANRIVLVRIGRRTLITYASLEKLLSREAA